MSETQAGTGRPDGWVKPSSAGALAGSNTGCVSESPSTGPVVNGVTLMNYTQACGEGTLSPAFKWI